MMATVCGGKTSQAFGGYELGFEVPNYWGPTPRGALRPLLDVVREHRGGGRGGRGGWRNVDAGGREPEVVVGAGHEPAESKPPCTPHYGGGRASEIEMINTKKKH